MSGAGRYEFLGCAVDACAARDAVERVRALAKGDYPGCVMFLNVDVIVKSDSNEDLRVMTHVADLTLMDGKPPLEVARRMGIPLPEKVSGSDLAPEICAMAAEEGLSVFFLGGREGVPEAAAESVTAAYPGIGGAGAYSPPLGFERSDEACAEAIARVRGFSPDILFVCLGCPKQEEFLLRHLGELGVPCAVCAGATVDFMAGSVARAPKWVSRVGLEWLYRFAREPRRLFKRYFVESWRFIALMRREMRREGGGRALNVGACERRGIEPDGVLLGGRGAKWV